MIFFLVIIMFDRGVRYFGRLPRYNTLIVSCVVKSVYRDHSACVREGKGTSHVLNKVAPCEIDSMK